MSAEDVIEMLLSVLIAGLVAALALSFWPGRRGGPSGPATGPGPVSAVLLPAPDSTTPPAAAPLAASGAAPLAGSTTPPAAGSGTAPPVGSGTMPPAAGSGTTPPAGSRSAPPVSSATASARRANSAEGLLSSRLLAGEVTTEQYRTAMACLAVREEARDPMRLPGEIGPTAD
ncbi:hypothetical protein Acy02nite_27720 [Actinoplanes cyaneus]|uniref:Uncharacterized protein n=1 Tax=Actinoplanes cyaneus TaxID=52696 RepID=A0A919IGS7_9ACTN|nr:hypothetical protein [Actinoplanes cyaneus]MCW2137900.1 hypothetical protein [Actinoplanes cyaneus]GID64891.1 hypothetical protein Acy02nite_27720 [Actinoplanes cyaneus]